MALGLYEVCVRVGTGTGFASKAPGGKNQFAQFAGLDGCLRPLDWLGVTVVEVDGKKEVSACSGADELIGLGQFEDQWFFSQYRSSGLDYLQRRFEMPFVG